MSHQWSDLLFPYMHFFLKWGFTKLPRLILNSWAQVNLLALPPKLLDSGVYHWGWLMLFKNNLKNY
jgi:hypothetical protein